MNGVGSVRGSWGCPLAREGCQIGEKVIELDCTEGGVGSLLRKFPRGCGTPRLRKRCEFSVPYQAQCVELCFLCDI